MCGEIRLFAGLQLRYDAAETQAEALHHDLTNQRHAISRLIPGNTFIEGA